MMFWIHVIRDSIICIKKKGVLPKKSLLKNATSPLIKRILVISTFIHPEFICETYQYGLLVMIYPANNLLEISRSPKQFRKAVKVIKRIV